MTSEKGQSDVQMRLRRVEGQIRGIIAMLDQGKTCEEVVTQLLAARAAMDGVTTEVLKCHIAEAMSDNSPDDARKAVERAITLLAKV